MREAGSKRWKNTSPYIDMVKYSFNRIWRFGKDKIIGSCIFIAGIMSVLLPNPSLAQQSDMDRTTANAKAAPMIALLPWQLIGWDGEFSQRNEAPLRALHQLLREQSIESAKTLSAWAKDQNKAQTLNQDRSGNAIWMGPSLSRLGFSAYIVPVLCPIGEHLVLALEMVETETQIVLAGVQSLSSRTAWENLAKADAQIPIEPLALILKDLLKELEVAALRRLQSSPSNAMKLSLRLLRGSDSAIGGAHQCHNMLLSHSLIEQVRVLSNLGLRDAAQLREILRLEEPPQRFNRALALDWGRLPLGLETFPFDARLIEGVLGGSIAPQIRGEALLKQNPARFELSKGFLDLLRNEKDQLKLADLPQIAHINRAWVYLDRGRAYGLDMDDRLVLDNGEMQVTGHVVGFFGPGAGIMSPRGFSVREGAIVFIRKGQKAVKVGDTMRFDRKTYPSPWPPQKTPR